MARPDLDDAHRPSTDEMRNSLKLSTRLALKAAGGAAALVREKLVRIGETALSFCGSAKKEHGERFVGLDVALDLDLCAGEPFHARALAAAQRYRLEPMEAPATVGELTERTVTRLGRAVIDFKSRAYDALEDGDLDQGEIAAMLTSLQDVDAEVANMRAKLVRAMTAAPKAGDRA